MPYITLFYNDKKEKEIMDKIKDLDCEILNSENSIIEVFDRKTIYNEIDNISLSHDNIHISEKYKNELTDDIIEFGNTNGLNCISIWDDMDDMIDSNIDSYNFITVDIND